MERDAGRSETDFDETQVSEIRTALLFDRTHSYQLALWITALLGVTSMCAILAFFHMGAHGPIPKSKRETIFWRLAV